MGARTTLREISISAMRSTPLTLVGLVTRRISVGAAAVRTDVGTSYAKITEGCGEQRRRFGRISPLLEGAQCLLA